MTPKTPCRKSTHRLISEDKKRDARVRQVGKMRRRLIMS